LIPKQHEHETAPQNALTDPAKTANATRGMTTLWQVLSALALGNGVYFTKWSDVTLGMGRTVAYYRAHACSLAFAASVLCSCLAVVAVAFCAIRLVTWRRWISESTMFRVVGSALLILFLTRMWPGDSQRVRLLAAVALAGATLLLGRRYTSAFGKPVVLAASAMLAVQCVSVAWSYARSPSESQLRNGPTAPLVAGTSSGTHTIWIIFDEFDYELSTELRPADVEMPNFDRLRGESLTATDAHSPAEWTSVSLPAYVTGKRLVDAYAKNASELYVWGEDQKPVLWQSGPNIFSYAHAKKLNSALIGWHHPYCRIFSQDVATCFWTPNVDATDSLREEYEFKRRGLSPVFPGRKPMLPNYTLVKRQLQDEYTETLQHALDAVANPNLNFIFLHWMIPHPPGIYDRDANELKAGMGNDYFDNLELVDFTLGKIRRKLETAGLWDKSAVIVAGDHPLRSFVWQYRPTWMAEEDRLTKRRQDPRIPLVIKLPYQHTSLVYKQPMDAVLVNGLVKEWMDGRTATPTAVSEYFDANRARFPVHLAQKRKNRPTAAHMTE